MRMLFSSILLRSINPRSRKFATSHKRCWSQSIDDHNHGLLLNFYCPSNSIFLRSNQQYTRFSSVRNDHENRSLLQVEIISKEFIKPATPTPINSKTYEVSSFDQLHPNYYIPFVYFYPNNQNHDSSDSINHDDLFLKRRQLLKKSLSETLAKFYPVAGRIQDSGHIDCNDDGVYYVEAKVNDLLSDFLKHPEYKSIHELLPLHPDSMEIRSKTDVAMVQVTSFSCGGIAIGLYPSHKIFDAYSIITFLKAWAATARAASEEICPSFMAPLVFPFNPALAGISAVTPMYSECKIATRRFVFPASSLITLKEKVGSSRVMGVIGLLIKCAIAASTSSSNQKYVSFSSPVNLREKISPPMPPYSIGNIFWISTPVQFSADEDLGLDSITQRLKNAIGEVNEDFVEAMKGEEFWLNLEKPMNELKAVLTSGKVKHITMSSLCNMGTYEVDFGWGKPIWVSFGLADTKTPILENFILLMDTRSGNGIEALVILPEQDMVVFERNAELLSSASLNPSPLQHVD